MEEKTTVFRSNARAQNRMAAHVLSEVYKALQAKGYNPVGQIVGYLLSGDPTYITSHGNARNLIRQLERMRFWKNWSPVICKIRKGRRKTSPLRQFFGYSTQRIED